MLGESMGMGHQVFKLNQQGEAVMRLGEAGVWGDGPNNFNGPSGVMVAPNGDIWVSDGHRGGNNRIVKLASDGTFLLEVGGGVGSESKRPRALAIRTTSRWIPGAASRRGSGQQPDPDLRQAGTPPLHLDALWQAERTVHRPRRYPLRGRWPVGRAPHRSSRPVAEQPRLGEGYPDRRPKS